MPRAGEVETGVLLMVSGSEVWLGIDLLIGDWRLAWPAGVCLQQTSESPLGRSRSRVHCFQLPSSTRNALKSQCWPSQNITTVPLAELVKRCALANLLCWTKGVERIWRRFDKVGVPLQLFKPTPLQKEAIYQELYAPARTRNVKTPPCFVMETLNPKPQTLNPKP